MAACEIRMPAAAGTFYPEDPEQLRDVVEEYINASKLKPAGRRVQAVVTPHSPYDYAGRTAGFAYARVRKKRPSRVILIGCSHHCDFPHASVCMCGRFDVPLGMFPVDEPFAAELAGLVETSSPEAHIPEHCLEIQLPFLAVALGEVPIVPVLLGAAAPEWHANLGKLLASMADEDDLLVATTDWSHDLDEETTNRVDMTSLATLLTQDWENLARGLAAGKCSMCAGGALIAAMAFARARDVKNWTLLDYATSAHATRDYEHVVSFRRNLDGT